MIYNYQKTLKFLELFFDKVQDTYIYGSFIELVIDRYVNDLSIYNTQLFNNNIYLWMKQTSDIDIFDDDDINELYNIKKYKDNIITINDGKENLCDIHYTFIYYEEFIFEEHKIFYGKYGFSYLNVNKSISLQEIKNINYFLNNIRSKTLTVNNNRLEILYKKYLSSNSSISEILIYKIKMGYKILLDGQLIENEQQLKDKFKSILYADINNKIDIIDDKLDYIFSRLNF